MSVKFISDRQISIIGNATFAALTVLSVVFWRERTVMLDAALQSFYIINDGKLAIQVQRFGAAFVQSFPLVASKLGFSLRAVLIFYSLGFVIFHWLCFFICDKVLKIKPLALAIVLFSTLMTVHTFFWIQNEIVQAVSLTFVFFAILIRRGSFQNFRWFDFPLTVALGATLVYFHPLVVFSYFFIIGFFLMQNLKPKTENTKIPPLSINLIFYAIGIFVTVFGVKKYVTTVSWYDAGSMERFQNGISRPITDVFSGDNWRLFFAHCADDFVLVLPTIATISVFYFWQKAFLKAAFFLVATFGYVFIVATSYFDSPPQHWFYLESQYLPLAAMLAVPFVFDFDPSVFRVENWELRTGFSAESRKKNFNAICLVALVAMLVFKIGYIVKTRSIYSKRLDYLTELLEKTQKLDGSKFLLDNKNVDERGKLFMTWGVAYETLYLSALASPDSTRSILVVNDAEKYAAIARRKDVFCTAFEKNNLTYDRLNRRFFNFTDTTRGYFFIQKTSFDRQPKEVF